ncbi:MAG: hypothetical protein JW749_11360 [Sedimentisphaerales bacterium]|nr:hypothetical protein [Sedimentisphaerales bacterium]
MTDNKANSGDVVNKEKIDNDTAEQKLEPASHFKRELVPLDEYAARQGLSSDIIEQQGRLGVLQIRKYKGKKYVVDVPAEQSGDFESEEMDEIAGPQGAGMKTRQTTASKLFTAGLVIGFMVIIVTVFWLYMDAETRLDDLKAEYTSLQNRFDDLAASTGYMETLREELIASKAELAQIQNRIAASRTELGKIRSDLNKSRQNLDTIQSELSRIQGQVSLSKVEIESVQNSLNASEKELDNIHGQNTAPAKP